MHLMRCPVTVGPPFMLKYSADFMLLLSLLHTVYLCFCNAVMIRVQFSARPTRIFGPSHFVDFTAAGFR